MRTVTPGRIHWKRPKNPKARKKHAGELSLEEQACCRVALAVLKVRFGSLTKVAKVMGLATKNVTRAGDEGWPVTSGMALEIARLAGVTFDDVISGRFPEPGACPMCGRRGDGTSG